MIVVGGVLVSLDMTYMSRMSGTRPAAGVALVTTAAQIVVLEHLIVSDTLVW